MCVSSSLEWFGVDFWLPEAYRFGHEVALKRKRPGGWKTPGRYAVSVEGRNHPKCAEQAYPNSLISASLDPLVLYKPISRSASTDWFPLRAEKGITGRDPKMYGEVR